MNEQIRQMKPKRIEMPEGIIYEIGYCNQRTIAEFPRYPEVIAGKKRREILPILYEGIIHDNPEVIEHKLMMKRVQIHEK